jgi:hypothetical protein
LICRPNETEKNPRSFRVEPRAFEGKSEECEGENSELEVRLTIAKLVVKQKRGGNEQPILEHRCQPCCPHRLPELSARVKNGL